MTSCIFKCSRQQKRLDWIKCLMYFKLYYETHTIYHIISWNKDKRSKKTTSLITFIHIYLYTYVFDCHCQKVWLITFSPVSINKSFFVSLETWEINQLKTVTGHFQHHWSTFSILHQDIKIYRYSVCFLFMKTFLLFNGMKQERKEHPHTDDECHYSYLSFTLADLHWTVCSFILSQHFWKYQ